MAIDDSPSPLILYPPWQNKYQGALLETDRETLKGRVEAAEAAIYERLQQISQNSHHDTERQAIEDALQDLRSLKKNELGFPDWENKK
jgi:hypothetical protein